MFAKSAFGIMNMQSRSHWHHDHDGNAQRQCAGDQGFFTYGRTPETTPRCLMNSERLATQLARAGEGLTSQPSLASIIRIVDCTISWSKIQAKEVCIPLTNKMFNCIIET